MLAFNVFLLYLEKIEELITEQARLRKEIEELRASESDKIVSLRASLTQLAGFFFHKCYH